MTHLVIHEAGLLVPRQTLGPFVWYHRPFVTVVRDFAGTLYEFSDAWVHIYLHQRLLWDSCIGFSLRCPPALALSGRVRVTEVLDRLEWVVHDSPLLDEYRAHLYQTAQGLECTLPPLFHQ